jgi:hypothetical protein
VLPVEHTDGGGEGGGGAKSYDPEKVISSFSPIAFLAFIKAITDIINFSFAKRAMQTVLGYVVLNFHVKMFLLTSDRKKRVNTRSQKG